MQNHLKMDNARWDVINRKLSIYDIELGAKDIVLRLDLDVAMTPFVAPPKAVEVQSITGKSFAERASERSQQAPAKASDNVSNNTSVSPLGEEENYWKARQILDHSWIKKTVAELRLCMERMVNRVFVIGNLGEKSGRIRGENSMKIIQNALLQHIDDVPIHFLPEAATADFLERKAMDEFADNCIYIVENLNFYPEEFSCVEPKPVDPDEEAKEKGEKPLGEGSGDVGQGSKPISRAKPTREASKAGLGEGAKTPAEGEEGAEEGEAEEEEKEEEAPPPFTVHSIHEYKRHLGDLADLYINDAPQASLSASNSVNEIACKQKIMGMKMTEDLRSIGQFFMKQFPLDVHSIYYKQPRPDLEYFACKSTAVIGGVCKTSQDILDKILLANSFLDTFEKIIFVGEVALACLYALGISPGKVERADAAAEEYESIKEFVLKLFDRSVAKQVEIVLPVDYVTAPMEPLEEIKAAAEAKAAEEKAAAEASAAELAN